MMKKIKSFADTYFTKSRIIALVLFFVCCAVYGILYSLGIFGREANVSAGAFEADETIPAYKDSFTGYGDSNTVRFLDAWKRWDEMRSSSNFTEAQVVDGIITGVLESTESICTLEETTARKLSSSFRIPEEITQLELPENVSYILSQDVPLIDSKGAFFGNTSLEKVFLPRKLKYIGNKAFYGVSSMSEILIPYVCEYIGDYSFAYCTSLSEIEIFGDTVVSNGAFTGCTSLSEVYLSDRVKRVGLSAFEHTPFFENLDDEFCVIGGVLIKYCGSGGDVVIPDSVRIIADGVFAGRASVVSVVIPESVEYIGNSAFRSCPELLNIYISSPESIIMGENAFDLCTKLSEESIALLENIKVDARKMFVSENSKNTLNGKETVLDTAQIFAKNFELLQNTDTAE